jgi:hypothetical protein
MARHETVFYHVFVLAILGTHIHAVFFGQRDAVTFLKARPAIAYNVVSYHGQLIPPVFRLI